MVQYPHVDQREGVLEAAGKQFVGLAGLGDTRRVVVGKYDRGRVGRERGFHHLPRVDAGLAEGAAEQFFGAQDAVLGVEKQGDEYLVLPRAQREAQVVAHRAGRGEGASRAHFLAQAAAGHFEHRSELRALGRAEALHRCGALCMQQAGEAA